MPCCAGVCPICGKAIRFLCWASHTKRHRDVQQKIETDKWRTLVRIVKIQKEGIRVIVPGFSSTKEVALLWEQLPTAIHHWFYEEGKRLHAKVNIGAEARKDLKFSDWEET